MRLIIVPLALLLLPAFGCSYFIATSGKDLSTIATRSMAHDELGKTVAAGKDEGYSYEDFKHYGKVRRDYHWGIGLVSSLGLAEVILFPAELMHVARGLIVGHKIRMYYNAKGEVILCKLNGWYLYGNGFGDHDSDSPELPDAAIDASLTLIP